MPGLVLRSSCPYAAVRIARLTLRYIETTGTTVCAFRVEFPPELLDHADIDVFRVRLAGRDESLVIVRQEQ